MELTKYKNSFSEAEFNSKLEEMQNQQTAFLDKRESALFGTAVLSDLLPIWATCRAFLAIKIKLWQLGVLATFKIGLKTWWFTKDKN